MKILIAPDKFKGSLTAEEVTAAIEQGVQEAFIAPETIPFPLADGGDGTARILTLHNRGKMVSIRVNNPVFEPVQAEYGRSGDGKTAYLEMSAASGLRVLDADKQNCYHTSTYGTGEMIADAIERGARKIIMGIGGSATNDAGTGMAAALGYRFLDEQGQELEPAGKNLIRIASIDDSGRTFDPGLLSMQIACDVDNPLFGERGAAYVYGPQKGASPDELDELNEGLMNFARVIREQMGIDVADIPGAGAAGGLGAGCMVFLGAKLQPGIQMVIEQSGFEEQAKTADLIITGEGRIDEQTFQGKVIAGVCQVASKYNKPILAVCGENTLERIPSGCMIAEVRSLVEHFGSRQQAMEEPVRGIRAMSRSMIISSGLLRY